MILITKIFHFETAHAIQGHPGACKHIHGHSYELHVTVSGNETKDEYFPGPGFIFDFKELKQFVTESIIKIFDHKLVLSKNYLARHPEINSAENLVTLEVEPTAENLIIYIRRVLSGKLPAVIKLVELKLFETKDSFVRWTNDNPSSPMLFPK